MKPFLSHPAFMVLARLYDMGHSQIAGTSLTLHYAHCMGELIECGALYPDEPLRSIDIETDAGEVTCEIYRSASGERIYMTEDGPFHPKAEARRQYRINFLWLMMGVNRALQLTGTVRKITEDAYYLGTLLEGREEHEIYWSRRLTKSRIESLDKALKERSLPAPAAVLCLHPPDNVAMTAYVQCLRLDAIWNMDHQIDPWRFQRCVMSNFLPSAVVGRHFAWLKSSSTFVFPDQRTFSFSDGHATTIVQLLVEQWHTGRPWIDEQHLLQDLLIGCQSANVKDVVKRTKEWQHVIWIDHQRCRLRVPLPGENQNNCPPWTKRKSRQTA